MDRVLYITKHNPWGIGGGSAASKMYLEAFRRIFINGRIDLCISEDIPQDKIPKEILEDENISIMRVPARSTISRIMSPLTGITHRYQKAALELINRNIYTYCIFDHSSIAGTLVNSVQNGAKTVVIHHNYEPDYFRDNTPQYWMRHILLPVVRHCEKTSYKKCDVNIFLTEEDKEQFEETYGPNYGTNIVTGLFEIQSDIRLPLIPSLKLDKPTILITGSLDNVQNVDGIRYFISELYPLIPADYKIIIAGREPGEDVKNLIDGKSNIELIPNPPIMADVIARGNIFLSPARLGGGIKVRISDGLKAGLPVIAHRTSARGYAPYIKSGYFKPFSTPEEFRNALEHTITEINNDRYKSDEISSLYSAESSMINAVIKIEKALKRY